MRLSQARYDGRQGCSVPTSVPSSATGNNASATSASTGSAAGSRPSSAVAEVEVEDVHQMMRKIHKGYGEVDGGLVGK